MIYLTRLNHKAFYLNCDLIEMVEETPDTLITMTTGKKFLVEDSASIVLEKIIEFRNRCFCDVTSCINTNSRQTQWDPQSDIIEATDWVDDDSAANMKSKSDGSVQSVMSESAQENEV